MKKIYLSFLAITCLFLAGYAQNNLTKLQVPNGVEFMYNPKGFNKGAVANSNSRYTACLDTVFYPFYKNDLAGGNLDVSFFAQQNDPNNVEAYHQAYHYSGSGRIVGFYVYAITDYNNSPGDAGPVAVEAIVSDIDGNNLPIAVVGSETLQLQDVGFNMQALYFTNPIDVSDNFALGLEISTGALATDSFMVLNTEDPNGRGENLAYANYFGTTYSILNDFGAGDFDFLILPIIEHDIEVDFIIDPSCFETGEEVFGENTSTFSVADSMFAPAMLYAYGGLETTYIWDAGDGSGYNDVDFFHIYNAPGKYIVELYDTLWGWGNTCGELVSQEIIVGELNLTSTDATCGASDGSVSLTYTGGDTPYNYTWFNTNFDIVGTSESVSGLPADIYIGVAEDASGCSFDNGVALNNAGAAVLSMTMTDQSCFGMSDGTGIISATGGVSPYMYSWEDLSGFVIGTAASITGLSEGVYFVTVTDDVGCQSFGGGEVFQPDPVEIDVYTEDATYPGGNDGYIDVEAFGGSWTGFTYEWENGATTDFRTGLFAGVYSVTATDANSCVGSEMITISEPPCDISVTYLETVMSCNGSTNGSAYIEAATSYGVVSFFWSDGGTSDFNTGMAAGVYSVTAVDQVGCAIVEPVTISDAPAITISSTITPDLCGDFKGEIDVTASGGYGNGSTYTYAWSDGTIDWYTNGGSMLADLLYGDTYSVTVMDNNDNCMAEESFTVTGGNGVEFELLITEPNCGMADGEASVSITSGTSPFTYDWFDLDGNSLGTDETATGLSGGIVVIAEIVDANGCANDEGNLVSNVGAPSITITSVEPTGCPDDANGSISATVSGGTTPYSYSWANYDFINEVTTDIGTGTSVTGLVSGVYLLTVEDSQNPSCIATTVTFLEGPEQFQTGEYIVSVTCQNGNDGAVYHGVYGGTTPYSYEWNNGATEDMITGLTAGTYTVTTTDDNGCTIENSYTVTEPSTGFTVDVITNNASCIGGSNGDASLTAVGSASVYYYYWEDNMWSDTRTGLAAGTYDVTVYDGEIGCTEEIQVSIGEDDGFSALVSSSDATCGNNNGSVTVTSSGGSGSETYNWSTGANTSSVGSLPAGVYDVTVVDAEGCYAEASGAISNSDGPQITADIMDVSCNGDLDGSVSITVTSGVSIASYTWNNGATDDSNTGLMAGTYKVTVTDGNGCEGFGSYVVDEPNALMIAMSATNETTQGDNDGTATATVSGGTAPYDYMWNNGETSASIANLMPDDYHVTVMDDNGCEASASVTVEEGVPAVCSISLTASSTDADCGEADGTATVMATGGSTPYSYSWETGENNSTASNLEVGVYSVTVFDQDLCEETTSVTVSGAAEVIIDVTATDPTCGNADGTASVEVTGGTSAYTYSWEDLNGNSYGDATTTSVTGLAFGAIIVTVTDANGCSAVEGSVLSEAGSASITLTTNDVSCNGAADGSIVATTSGGAAPLTFQWGTFNMNTNVTTVLSGETSSSITGLSGNNDNEIYFVTVTGNDGCSSTDATEVSEPDAIVLSTTSVSVSAAGASDGQASVSVTGGSAPYTYSWTNGGTTSSIGSLAGGVYSVTVTDGNGCVETGGVAVAEPGVSITCNLSISITSSNVTSNGGNDGSAQVVLSGNQGNISYNWSNSANTSSISNLVAGEYSVTVTDDIVAGCTATESVTISEPTGITEMDNSLEFGLYPNPNNGTFTINIENANGVYNVNVMNVIGQSVYQEVILVEGNNSEIIDLGIVESGIYFVQLKGENEETIQKMIVK